MTGSRRFDDLFAALNTNRKQQHDIGDDEAERLNEQELKLLNKIIATPATGAGEIAAKVGLNQHGAFAWPGAQG